MNSSYRLPLSLCIFLGSCRSGISWVFLGHCQVKSSIWDVIIHAASRFIRFPYTVVKRVMVTGFPHVIGAVSCPLSERFFKISATVWVSGPICCLYCQSGAPTDERKAPSVFAHQGIFIVIIQIMIFKYCCQFRGGLVHVCAVSFLWVYKGLVPSICCIHSAACLYVSVLMHFSTVLHMQPLSLKSTQCFIHEAPGEVGYCESRISKLLCWNVDGGG